MYAPCSSCFFLFNDTATTEIYTLSLHDALPISRTAAYGHFGREPQEDGGFSWERDRKSTRLNSSHTVSSYAVFCLKNKKETRDVRPFHNRTHDQRHDSLASRAP